MMWNQIRGVANELRDTVLESWGRLTGNDFDLVDGRPETLEEHMAVLERIWV